MLPRKLKFSSLTIFISLFLFMLFSCKKPVPPPNPVDRLIKVYVQNPEWGLCLGYSNQSCTTVSPGYEIEITVNTINSSNQAVYYSSKTISVSHSSIVSSGINNFTVNDVKIPASGAYNIQFQLRSLDCTWPFTSNACQSSSFGYASRKYFKGQDTYPNGGSPGFHNFICNIANKYYENCC